jgi:hypothetical protein
MTNHSDRARVIVVADHNTGDRYYVRLRQRPSRLGAIAFRILRNHPRINWLASKLARGAIVVITEVAIRTPTRR